MAVLVMDDLWAGVADAYMNTRLGMVIGRKPC